MTRAPGHALGSVGAPDVLDMGEAPGVLRALNFIQGQRGADPYGGCWSLISV